MNELVIRQFGDPREIAGVVLNYRDIMLLYESAMKTLCTKFEIINNECNATQQRNPIHNITSRLKNIQSIIGKLQRLNVDITVENMQRLLHDIAGVRVICSYLDDVYDVARMISDHPEIKLITQKDYIRHPKPNGYRSLHLILGVPVYFSGREQIVEVEVQLRTIAMDFWASLEHQLKYKQEISSEEDIVGRLRACAESIAKNDVEMLKIRKGIEESKASLTDDELLVERLRSLDILIK